jgi:hypothetical protein
MAFKYIVSTRRRNTHNGTFVSTIRGLIHHFITLFHIDKASSAPIKLLPTRIYKYQYQTQIWNGCVAMPPINKAYVIQL